VCQSARRAATSAVSGRGFAALLIQEVGSAVAAPQFCTVQMMCSPVGAVSVWRIRANKRLRNSEAFADPEKLGCAWAVQKTCLSHSLKDRAECTEQHIDAFAVLAKPPMLVHLSICDNLGSARDAELAADRIALANYGLYAERRCSPNKEAAGFAREPPFK
jgi:hypothetical protein